MKKGKGEKVKKGKGEKVKKWIRPSTYQLVHSLKTSWLIIFQ